jgi:hypothetical protein
VYIVALCAEVYYYLLLKIKTFFRLHNYLCQDAMKKTVYFNSHQVYPNGHPNIPDIINAVTGLRDAFLEENRGVIAKIEDEQIQFISLPGNVHYAVAIITLAYYEKQI